MDAPLTSQIVKFALFAYVLFAGLSVYLLWKNAAAPDAIKNTGIAMASILPILLSALPYLTAEKIEKNYNYFLVFDQEEKYITFGNAGNAYFSAYIPAISNLNRSALSGDTFGDFMGKNGLDIIERAVLEGLLARFSYGWDMTSVQFKAPNFTSTQYFPGRNVGKTEIKLPELLSKFTHNSIISSPGVVVQPQLVLPPKSSFDVERIDRGRVINIENQNLSISIEITSEGGGVLQQGVWGVLKADQSNINRYFGLNYRIHITGKVARMKSFSPDMNSYRGWFDSVTQALSQFDWETIDNKINESLMRESILKNLDDH